jgi:hypothetical protein
LGTLRVPSRIYEDGEIDLLVVGVRSQKSGGAQKENNIGDWIWAVRDVINGEQARAGHGYYVRGELGIGRLKRGHSPVEHIELLLKLLDFNLVTKNVSPRFARELQRMCPVQIHPPFLHLLRAVESTPPDLVATRARSTEYPVHRPAIECVRIEKESVMKMRN